MNYIQIMGGLGNQFFQYVFAKYVENNTGIPSVLHTGFYNRENSSPEITTREYVLDKFETRYICANGYLVCEREFMDNDAELCFDYDGSFYNGYWQNKIYYLNVLDSISGDFCLKQEYISDELSDLANEIKSCESVAIHVRRTDYLNKYNRDIFWELSTEYYTEAVKYIISQLGFKPTLYIFSDDYDFIHTNMDNFLDCKTVHMKPGKDYEDFFLMTKAKHHITANSTFSFWGALLSANKEGIKIAPDRWYKSMSDPDIYTDKWIKIRDRKLRPLISVIIPAYNVKQYIGKCLESIEQQTYGFDNLELIIIDDASTDGTTEYLESFESKHNDNVILIKQNINSGPGAARNIGLDYANGEFITFIDSDDFVDYTMVEKLYEELKKYDSDVAECSYRQVINEDEAVVIKDIDNPFYLDASMEDDFKYLIALTCAKTSVWGRLYKKSFIVENNLRFVENYVYEDVPFSGLAVFSIKSYCRLNETLYYYRYNSSGITFSAYKKEKVHEEAAVVNEFFMELEKRNMLSGIMSRNKADLATYCMVKSFLDPLMLLVRSTLDIYEILSEIRYFKNELLKHFQDVNSLYYLKETFSISTLGIHLLDSECSLTEKILNEFKDENVLLVSALCDMDTSRYNSILYPYINNINDMAIVSISRQNYEKESLLLRRAIAGRDIIVAETDKCISVESQKQMEQFICSVIGDYPDNRVILLLRELFISDSYDSISSLEVIVEKIKSHNNIMVLIEDKMTYDFFRNLSLNIRMEYLDYERND